MAIEEHMLLPHTLLVHSTLGKAEIIKLRERVAKLERENRELQDRCERSKKSKIGRMQMSEFDNFIELLKAAPGYVKENVMCYYHHNTSACRLCPKKDCKAREQKEMQT